MSFSARASSSGVGTTLSLGTVIQNGDALVATVFAIQGAADQTALPQNVVDSFGNTYSILQGTGSSAINQACASGNFVSYAIYVCPRAVSPLTPGVSITLPAAWSTPSLHGIAWFYGDFITNGEAAFQNNGFQTLLSQTAPFSLAAGTVANGVDELALGFALETGNIFGGVPRFTSYLHELNNASANTDWGFADASVAGGTGVVAANVNTGNPAPPVFVQAATGTHASATSFTQAFASNNVAGNAIIVAISVQNNGNVPVTVTDSAGNTYTLAAQLGNIAFDNVLVYVALNIAAGANTITVTLGSAAALGLAIHEFSNVAHATALDGTAVAHAGGITASLAIGPATTTAASDLLFTLIATSNAGATFTPPVGYLSRSGITSGNGLTFDTASNSATVAGNYTATWTGISGEGGDNGGVLIALKPPVTVSPETMGFLVRLGALNSTGGSAASTLAFRILKAPAPIVPHEGRAIATVQIDCTQINFSPIQSQGGAFPAQSLQYPEYTFDSSTSTKNTGFESFAVTEFDLEHITNRGQGLSEVRGIMAVSRPMFQFDINDNPTDSPFTGGFVMGKGIAILTNVATLQSAILGEKAMAWHQGLDSQGAPVETMHMPFYAVKGGMKFRLLLLCNLYPLTGGQTTGVGKYTINFTNFELPSSFVHVGGWYGDL